MSDRADPRGSPTRERIVEAAIGTGSVARAIDAEPLRRAAPGAVTLPAREP